MVTINIACFLIGVGLSLLSSPMYSMEVTEDDMPSIQAELQIGLGQHTPPARSALFSSNKEDASLFTQWLIKEGKLKENPDFILWLIQNNYINEETLLGSDGQTPAHFALMLAEDPAQVLEWLRARGFSLHEPDEKGRLPMHYAAYYNLIEVIHILIPRIPNNNEYMVNVQDNEGRSPLFYAAQGGAQKIIFYLTTSHTKTLNLALRDSRGASVLHYGMLSRNEQTVLYLWKLYHKLRENGQYVDQDDEGRRPIHYGARVGFQGFFEALDDHQERDGYPGVNIGVCDNYGNTLFHYAAQAPYSKDVLEAEIGNNNYDLFLPNNAGQSPADIVRRRGLDDVASELFRQELCAGNYKGMERLLALGMNISEPQDSTLETKMSLLEMNKGNLEHIRALLSWGIKWEHREELTELLRQAFSELEAEYTSLNNEGAPTWELPLMCLPCFYEQHDEDLEECQKKLEVHKKRIYEHILRLRSCFESQDENVRKYVANLVNQTLLIAMAYGRLEVVEEIISHVRSSRDENVMYYINNATWIQLFLRSVLVSRQALGSMFFHVSKVLNPQEIKELLKRALLLAFGQRQFDSLSFLLEHRVHIPEAISLHNRVLVIRSNNTPAQEGEKEKEASIPDEYARMLALLRDYYSSYITLLWSNQQLANESQMSESPVPLLPPEMLALIMYWFINGYLYNYSAKSL